MGCCSTNYKFEMEDYFKFCLNNMPIRKISPSEAYDLLIENELKGDSVSEQLSSKASEKKEIDQKYIVDHTNDKPSTLQIEVINKLNKSVPKEKYKELLKLFFVKETKIDGKNNYKEFPNPNEFIEFFFDGLYNSNKYYLMINIFFLFDFEKNKESNGKVFFKLLEKLFGKGKITYLTIKKILLEYISTSLKHPLIITFQRSENLNHKDEMRFIEENDLSEHSVNRFFNSILNPFEINFKLSHEDDYLKDSSIIKLEEFEIMTCKEQWSWDIFKLRDNFFVKSLTFN